MIPRVFDITTPITPALPVWPGDTPLTREVLLDRARGDTVTLSTLRATVHLGTHADGPNHYSASEQGVGEQPLTHFLGPAQVVDAATPRGARVRPEHIVGGIEQITCPRVLIRTGTFPDPHAWNSDFAGLDPTLLDALAARPLADGQRLLTIGVDTPSVDLQESKDLPAHAACLRHGVLIIEGLRLAGVPAGRYELIALPLALVGFDASPVRAVLRELA